jgi:hypothetical protein
LLGTLGEWKSNEALRREIRCSTQSKVSLRTIARGSSPCLALPTRIGIDPGASLVVFAPLAEFQVPTRWPLLK